MGGLAFTGLTIYSTHVKTAPKRKIAVAEKAPAKVAAV